jgi:hypothetical protein
VRTAPQATRGKGLCQRELVDAVLAQRFPPGNGAYISNRTGLSRRVKTWNGRCLRHAEKNVSTFRQQIRSRSVQTARPAFRLTSPPPPLPIPTVSPPYPHRSTSARFAEVLRWGYGVHREGIRCGAGGIECARASTYGLGASGSESNEVGTEDSSCCQL